MKQRKNGMLFVIVLIFIAGAVCASFDRSPAGPYPSFSDTGDGGKLIRADGEGGVEGYVWSNDLEGYSPASPEEALAIQAQREKEGYTGRYVNLYERDGKTIIGRFHVGEAKDFGVLREIWTNLWFK